MIEYKIAKWVVLISRQTIELLQFSWCISAAKTGVTKKSGIEQNITITKEKMNLREKIILGRIIAQMRMPCKLDDPWQKS